MTCFLRNCALDIATAMDAQLPWVNLLFFLFCNFCIPWFDSQWATHAVTTSYMSVSPRKSIFVVGVESKVYQNVPAKI